VVKVSRYPAGDESAVAREAKVRQAQLEAPRFEAGIAGLGGITRGIVDGFPGLGADGRIADKAQRAVRESGGDFRSSP
jgi:hypothetical protein